MKKLFPILGAAALGLALWAYAVPNGKPPAIVNNSQQTIEGTSQTEIYVPRKTSRMEVPRINQQEDYGLDLEGIVTNNGEPFPGVPLEIGITSGRGVTDEKWKGRTGSDGTFTTPVTGGFYPYDITATDNTTNPPRQRSVQTTPGQFVSIEFIDSPDVLVSVTDNKPITHAFLTAKDGRTLESKITVEKGTDDMLTQNIAFFRDVQEAPYTLTLIAGGTVLQDDILVFEEGGDITKTYGVDSTPALPESVEFTGSVSDRETGINIDTAILTFTLPHIDHGLYSRVIHTTDKGNFSNNFPQTTHEVKIAAPGYVTSQESIAIKNNDHKNFRLHKGKYSIEGTVLANGKPLERAEVYFLLPGHFTSKNPILSLTTDAQGAFTVDESFDALPQAVAFKNGFYQVSHDLHNGRSILYMAKNDSTLEGRIYDSNHKGIPAKVTLHLVELPNGLTVDNLPETSLNKSVLTTDDGSYTFGADGKPLSPGNYFMRIIPHADLENVVGKSTRIAVQGVVHQDVYLPKGIPIEGTVSWNNTPVDQAHISFSTPGRKDIASITDNEGKFTAIVPYGQEVTYFAWHHGKETTGSFMPTTNHTEPITFPLLTPLPIRVHDKETKSPVQYFTSKHYSSNTKGHKEENHFTLDGRASIAYNQALDWLEISANNYKPRFIKGKNIPPSRPYIVELEKKK